MRRILGAAIAVAFVAAPAVARAIELQPYTVQAGDDCGSIALKMYGDRDHVDPIHDNNGWLGPLPHKLVPGATLMLPPPAKVAKLKNRVEVEAKPTKTNAPLYRGNRVSTGDLSSADLEFRDTTRLALGERTLVVILGGTRSAVSRTDVTLVTGKLRSRFAELSGAKAPPAAIATESADVKVGPGEAQVTVDGAKATRLAVYTGQSSVTAQKKTVAVPNGFGSKAEKDKPPTPPRPLPPAPLWRDNASSILALGAEPAIAVTYGAPADATPAAAEWHVQIATDAAFDDLLVDTVVPARIVDIDAKAPKLGKYFLRVSAIDADHFEGPYGAPLAATVALRRRTVRSSTKIALAFEGAACGVDGAVPVPDLRVELSTLRERRISCVADGAVSNESIEPARDAGAAFAAVRYEQGAGGLDLVASVKDGAGAPLDDADVDVVAIGGRTMPFVRDGAVFRARVLARAPLAVSLRVAGVERERREVREDANVAALDRRTRIEASGFFGFGTAAGVERRGTNLGLALGAGIDLGRVELGLGGRATYETYRDQRGKDGGEYDQTFLVFDVPVSLRVGRRDAPVRPYLSLAPVVIAEIASGPNDASDVLFGGVGALGMDVVLGGGRLFVEAGGRFTNVVPRTSIRASGTGVVSHVGYRLAF